MVALATIIIIGGVVDQNMGIQVENEVLMALAALAINLVLNTFLSTVVVIIASIYQVRVYIRSNLRTIVKGKLSNASRIGPPPRHVANVGKLVVITAMIVPVVVAAVIAMAILTLCKPVNAPVNMSEIVLMFGLIFGVPTLAIPVCFYIASRVIAKSPRECWPPGMFSPRTDEFKFL